MTRKLLGIPFVAMLMAVCHGAETMAYHFASEPVIPALLSGCPLLKVAPAATPFVASGDELRDLTEVFRNAKVPLANGWAIWNQSQRLLVVHGGIIDQWRIEKLSEFREQTRHAKLTLNWIRDEESATPTQKNDAVFVSLGLLSKSAIKTTASSHVVDPSGDWSFSVDGESTVDGNNGIHSRIGVAWKGPDGDSTQHGTITTNIFITDGNTLSLASWHVAGHGPAWRMTINGGILLADETAWRKALLRQAGEKTEVVNPADLTYEVEFHELPTAGDRKLLTKELGRDIIQDFLGLPTEHNRVADPFAEPPNPTPEQLPDLPDLAIPANLGNVLPGPLLDLRTLITASGVQLGADDFVAYDPLAERLVVYCKEERTVDMLEQLFMIMYCHGLSPNIECAAWLTDKAIPESPWVNLSLLAKSGMKSEIKILDAKDQPIATFEVEPIMGGKIAIVELGYDFNCHLQQQSTNLKWHNQSSVNLSDDVPFVTDATKLPDGRSLKQGLRAKFIK